jgi:hypothetical protein
MGDQANTALGPADIQAWRSVGPQIVAKRPWYTSPWVHFAGAVISLLCAVPAIGGPVFGQILGALLVAFAFVCMIALTVLPIWLTLTLVAKIMNRKKNSVELQNR